MIAGVGASPERTAVSLSGAGGSISPAKGKGPSKKPPRVFGIWQDVQAAFAEDPSALSNNGQSGRPDPESSFHKGERIAQLVGATRSWGTSRWHWMQDAKEGAAVSWQLWQSVIRACSEGR